MRVPTRILPDKKAPPFSATINTSEVPSAAAECGRIEQRAALVRRRFWIALDVLCTVHKQSRSDCNATLYLIHIENVRLHWRQDPSAEQNGSQTSLDDIGEARRRLPSLAQALQS
jgi:hypothetical protein